MLGTETATEWCHHIPVDLPALKETLETLRKADGLQDTSLHQAGDAHIVSSYMDCVAGVREAIEAAHEERVTDDAGVETTRHVIQLETREPNGCRPRRQRPPRRCRRACTVRVRARGCRYMQRKSPNGRWRRAGRPQRASMGRTKGASPSRRHESLSMSAATPTTLVATAPLHGHRVLSNLVVDISRHKMSYSERETS